MLERCLSQTGLWPEKRKGADSFVAAFSGRQRGADIYGRAIRPPLDKTDRSEAADCHIDVQ